MQLFKKSAIVPHDSDEPSCVLLVNNDNNKWARIQCGRANIVSCV